MQESFIAVAECYFLKFKLQQCAQLSSFRTNLLIDVVVATAQQFQEAEAEVEDLTLRWEADTLKDRFGSTVTSISRVPQ